MVRLLDALFLFHSLAVLGQINDPDSNSTYMPPQALAPTPQLYDELVADGMVNLAKATVAKMGPIKAGSVILDDGCGTGAGTAAIADAVGKKVLPKLKFTGVDIDPAALEVYKQNAANNSWPAKALLADAQNLTAYIKDCTFTHVIGTAFLFVLPDDAIPAMQEMVRTLKPAGVAALNTWAYVPNLDPIRIASQQTRPAGFPELRGGTDQWSDPAFLKSKIKQAGFKDVTLSTANVYTHTAEFDRYANMLWSFIGGTTSEGWIPSDEENWDKAISIIKTELAKTDGFVLNANGTLTLKFVANIAIAYK
ncbi:hypothetical protein SLS60_004310 [Paraconiothyrium brasiliense]|uniref:Methyltransferase domain-containing protein n=1 Tax=Paraconiothyrium brasiliense TaxID=300254 RepID=A0ABR3RK18_9PLEO